jgi:TusE/DsrC/DsvC family sulfur relay protein
VLKAEYGIVGITDCEGLALQAGLHFVLQPDIENVVKVDVGEQRADHWDVIEYLRDAYYNHNGEQPNNRAMLKAMQDKWPGRKVDNKTLFDLYPGNPSKQAGKIAGLPESLRKGGY